MALRSFPYLPFLFLFHLYKDSIVSATTTVLFYTDASCKLPYGTIETDTDAGNGQCGEFATSINSARSNAIDYGCSVTAYTGSDFCSVNATLVPIGICTDMGIGSFSVDCPQMNGTNDLGYTTSLASHLSSGTSVPSTISTSTSSVPLSPSSSSQQVSATGISSRTLLYSTTSSSSSSSSSSLTGLPTPLLNDFRPSLSSSLQPSSLPPSSPSPTLSPSPSPSPSSSSSQGQRGSGNDGGLSGPSTIAIGVVLPGVAVIVAIIFGVLGVKKWKHNRPHILPDRRWSW